MLIGVLTSVLAVDEIRIRAHACAVFHLVIKKAGKIIIITHSAGRLIRVLTKENHL
jgi:hypothetical protein